MFFIEAIKTIKATGAISPCTNSSAKKVASIIKIKHHKDSVFTIAELGAGTGVFTKEILKEFPNVIIHAIEINPHFIEQLEKKQINEFKNL